MTSNFSSPKALSLLFWLIALSRATTLQDQLPQPSQSFGKRRQLNEIDSSLCLTTTSGTSWGGNGDDYIIDADSDDFGNVYLVGETISSDYILNSQDIFIFKLASDLTIEWGRSWSGTSTEYATCLSVDKDSNSAVFVGGYTNSAELVLAKEDLFVIKFTSDGAVDWSVRLGSDQIDYGLGMYYHLNNIYVVGSTSSTTWTSSDTDMLFFKLASSDNSLEWIQSLGGTQDDTAMDLYCGSDSNCYAVGYGSSIEMTNDQSIDIFLIKYSQSGVLDFIKHFGGNNPDYPDSITSYGIYLYITGYSLSDGLTSGLDDMFLIQVTKTGGLRWARYTGTAFYSEHPHSLAVSPNGNIYFMGTLSSVDHSYGQDDVILIGANVDGDAIFIENIGGELKESPGGIIYNADQERIQVFFNTQSDELGDGTYTNSLSGNGGYDFVAFDLDEWGANQCKELTINNLTINSAVTLERSTSYSMEDVPVTVSFLSVPTASAKSIISGSIKTLSTTQTPFCSTFVPVLPTSNVLEDTTVIQNTYMYHVLTGFCETEGATLTYSLVKEDGSVLDDWMIFNDLTLIVQGLVPEPDQESEVFQLIGTDDEGTELTATFTVYYLSTPYLSKELPDVSLRTLEYLTYTIPTDTFEQPDSLSLTYNISDYPDWLTLDERSLTLYGTPDNTDQGTYTIKVFVEDPNEQNATTTFQISVEKNYAPVAQVQVDDQQLDIGDNFTLVLPSNTFVDPNGDDLTITTSTLPSWLTFDTATLTFKGVPDDFSNYTIEVMAEDDWGQSADISFTIYTGRVYTYGPLVGTLLEDHIVHESQLFVYKFPDDIFIPQTEPDLTIYVTGPNGTDLPEWLSYEEVSSTISGTPNSTTEPTEIFVTADDRRGGYAFQSFRITEIVYIIPEEISYFELIIVSACLGGFIFLATVFLCCKNIKCPRCRDANESDDSFEDDDDVCVEEAQPKNPFKIQEELKQKQEQTKKMHKDQRFQVYTKPMDDNVRVRKPVIKE